MTKGMMKKEMGKMKKMDMKEDKKMMKKEMGKMSKKSGGKDCATKEKCKY